MDWRWQGKGVKPKAYTATLSSLLDPSPVLFLHAVLISFHQQ